MIWKWDCRGQIIPTKKLVTIEAAITAIDDERRLLKANSYLHDFPVRAD